MTDFLGVVALGLAILCGVIGAGHILAHAWKVVRGKRR